MSDPILLGTLSTGATHALETLPSFDTLLGEYKANWEIALERPL
jgi:hypothetical protein